MEWVGGAKARFWLNLRDGETGRDEGGNRRKDGLFIPLFPA